MVTTVPAAGTGGILGPLGSFGVGLWKTGPWNNYGIPNGMSLGDYLRMRQQQYQQGRIDTSNGDSNILGPPVPPTDPGYPSNLGSFIPEFLKNLPAIITAAKTPGSTAPGNAPNATNPTGGIDWTKYLPLIISSAIAGGLENRSQTATGHSTNTPTYNPEDNNFKTLLTDKYMSLIGEDPNLKGYQANALSDINRSYDLKRQQLSSSGLSGPALDLALQNLDNSRFSEGVRFNNTIPLLSRDLRSQALNSAAGYFNTLPYGNEVNTEQKQSGNVLGGITGGLAEALALMYGINSGR